MSQSPRWEPPEAEDEQVIWRYMDLEKYLSIIERKEVRFSEQEELEDPFEGKPPIDKTIKWRKEIKRKSQNKSSDHSDRALKALAGHQEEWFVSCWSAWENQSNLLWDAYTNGPPSVAIKSTVGDFLESIGNSPKVHHGSVQYGLSLPDDKYDDRLVNIFHKRPIFEGENEYRFVISQKESSENSFKCNLNTLINSVYVHPYTDNWVFSLIKEISPSKVEDKIKKSEIFDNPLE